MTRRALSTPPSSPHRSRTPPPRTVVSPSPRKTGSMSAGPALLRGSADIRPNRTDAVSQQVSPSTSKARIPPSSPMRRYSPPVKNTQPRRPPTSVGRHASPSSLATAPSSLHVMRALPSQPPSVLLARWSFDRPAMPRNPLDFAEMRYRVVLGKDLPFLSPKKPYSLEGRGYPWLDGVRGVGGSWYIVLDGPNPGIWRHW